MAATSALTAVNPFIHANASAASGTSTSGSATISSNDFLTLLVTEMKNQDPTAQTDPNAYVNQLVQVNSLEQLIEINEKTKTSGAASQPVGGVTAGTGAANGGAHPPGKMAGIADSGSRRTGTSHPIPVTGKPIAAMAGNLGVPAANPAAQRVAQALSGHK